jgi:hypothetical protein
MSICRRLLVSVLLLVAAPPLQGQEAGNLGGDFFEALQYRHIGPVGNRVSAVVGIPGDPNVYYIGAASGGVFKTVDAGVHWQPVFDDQPAQSIGALAVDPTNPNVVWAGTGEAHIRSNVSVGNGVYKTTDGGKTWFSMGPRRSEGYSGPKTEERAGSGSSSLLKTPVPRMWSWTPTTRTFFSRECGRWSSGPGGDRAVGLAAASSAPRMEGTVGNGWRATASPDHPWGRWSWP